MYGNLRLASRLVLLLLAASIGCDETEAPPSLSIGFDLDGFVSLEGGETRLLERGTQGGHHIDLAIRVERLEAEGALMELEGVDADTGEALFVSVVRQLSAATVTPYDERWVHFDERLVWIDSDPSSGEGRRVLLRATVTDALGESRVEGQVEVSIGYPTLTIGADVGGLQFAPSMDGDTTELEAGAQGGIHVWVAVRANHVEVDGAILSVNGIDADTGQVLTISSLKLLSPFRVTQEGSRWTRFDEQMVLLSGDPLDAVGRRIRVEASVTDPRDGRVAADTVTLNVVNIVSDF